MVSANPLCLLSIRMTRDLRTERMLKVATADTTDSTVGFPTDFLEVREIHMLGNPPVLLEFQSPDLFFRDGQTTLSGRPHYFTMLGTEFKFAPGPDTSYTVQILYYAQPTFISSTTASNLFLAYYPDALLYATLAEAEPYLYNDARIATWSALYDRAIANIKIREHHSIIRTRSRWSISITITSTYNIIYLIFTYIAC